MMEYKKFEKMCKEELKKELATFDKKEIEDYLEDEDSKKIIKRFYDIGVERFNKGKKHDDEIAFRYCIDTAVENLRLMF